MQRSRIWKVVYPLITVLTSSMFFSLSYFAAKSLHGVSGIELGSVRSFLMALMLLVPSIYKKKFFEMFKFGKAKYRLLFRCSLAVIGTICIYTGVKFIDLPDFTAIQYTYLVITAIFARIFLKERFGWIKALASMLALFGVIMVTQPEIFTTMRHTVEKNISKSNEGSNSESNLRMVGVVLSLCSALISASVFCVVRTLVTGEDAIKSTVIVFTCSWITAITLLFIAFFHRLMSHSLPTPNWRNFLYILLGSVSALLGHLLQNEALRVSSATFVAIGRSSAIVFSFIFQIIISPSSVLQKHVPTFVGIVVIVISVTSLSLDNLRNKGKTSIHK
ncbi:hypothetical protein GJ496_006873 [Pomphorhynchus laevis]|nr:hypothetical protein GJ496_006873 [Pomphorhynchus laevis]